MIKILNNKIIFWISADLLTYCLAYFLQKNYNGDFYSITDITNKPKKFFKEQNLVDFSKNWFLHDNIKIHKNPDLKYLKNFQNKFNIDLSELVRNDRIFNHYNELYEFSQEQINSILENECKLFEMILDEANPDYFITGETALRPHHLFYEMCKQKGIKVLMLNHANWKTLCYISQNRHKMDYIKKISDEEYDKCNFEFLQNLWEKSKVSKYHSKFHNQIKNSKISLFKAAMKYLFSSNGNIKTHYTYFGRHKLKILYNELKNSRIKKQRQRFIDLNLLQNFENSGTPFVYLPLHQEPERSLLIAAPKFSDQIETIQEIIKYLPENYELYVKEHPTQGTARGWRDISFYQKIMKYKKVKFFHPSFDSKTLLENCKLVISVGGTSSFEAAFFGKPSIIFANLGYSLIPSIKKLSSYYELKQEIHDSLNVRVNPNHVYNYIKILEENSFDFDILNFEQSYHNWFFLNGNLVDVNIDVEKMKQFLLHHENDLKYVSSEFMKKINASSDSK
jgi:hypothetical protein